MHSLSFGGTFKHEIRLDKLIENKTIAFYDKQMIYRFQYTAYDILESQMTARMTLRLC